SLIVDVGGGSTLLSLLQGPEILASQSLPLGAIRMQEALQTCHETPRRAAQIIKTRIAHEIVVAGRQLLPARIGLLIAMGSNIGLVG
ncbi:Ppx/GppA phosphatase family protein, partial [Staphylococcus aureus]